MSKGSCTSGSLLTIFLPSAPARSVRSPRQPHRQPTRARSHERRPEIHLRRALRRHPSALIVRGVGDLGTRRCPADRPPTLTTTSRVSLGSTPGHTSLSTKPTWPGGRGIDIPYCPDCAARTELGWRRKAAASPPLRRHHPPRPNTDREETIRTAAAVEAEAIRAAEVHTPLSPHSHTSHATVLSTIWSPYTASVVYLWVMIPHINNSLFSLTPGHTLSHM